MKMEGFEIQVSRAGAKSQPVNSLLLVGLKVRRGKAGEKEKRVGSEMTRWSTSRPWLCKWLSLVLTAALGSQREINLGGTPGPEPCLFLSPSDGPDTERKKLSKYMVNERMAVRMETAGLTCFVL